MVWLRCLRLISIMLRTFTVSPVYRASIPLISSTSLTPSTLYNICVPLFSESHSLLPGTGRKHSSLSALVI
ncbi:hypothetical protein BDQ17DRAFT_1377548 [Cyathus striatus]|nr:hypothetical protein BDQ17DRAFT_1377548 [Cyathus striatus]